MPKPSSADLLAYQLEQAATSKSGLSTSPLSSPPLASHPASPFEDPYPSSTRANGLVGAAPSDEWTPSAEIVGRGTARRSGESEEEETDDEFEDELNDFGYGAPKRRKEKKETLMDILNSEPPAWMVQTPPTAITPEETPSLGSKRSGTFSSRLRQRFGSTSPQTVDAATTSGPDTHAGLTTLRTSRSAGNLLSSLRGKLSSSTGRSREDLLSSSPLPPTPHELPYSTFMTHRTTSGDSFAPFDPQSVAPKPVPPTPKKLHAKGASAAPPSTRDLASFLRDSGPTLQCRSIPPPAHPPRSHSRTASSDASERLSRSQNGSFDATRGSGGTSVVKAAIVKLGASGRRMSLVALSPFDKHINSSPSSEALLERSASPQHGRTVSEASAAYLGVREFVELDEKEHADRLPVETRAGKIASRLELVAGGTGARLTRSSSQRLASPQRIPRKPVPASIPPLEELLTSPRSSSRSHIKQSTLDALQRLQDRGDTGPLAVGESPIKGLEGAEMDRMRAFSAPPASPRYDQSTGLAPLTPLSPSPTLYATPPVTPIPADFVPPPRTPSAPAALSQAPAIPSKSQKRLSVQALGQSALPTPSSAFSMLPYINGTPISPLREEKSSGDSVLDPPLSAALATPTYAASPHNGASGFAYGDGHENPVVAALLALRQCMATTASLPVDLATLDACDDTRPLDVVLPTLKGMRDQMRLAADLVDAVVEACEAKQAGGPGSQGEDVGRLVGALSGEDHASTE
ncbi:hypothetical protein NBRC10512v2_000201 [Rhodotorula toruloides]|uniref:Uncharacterized protein n=1 Tax=Rhodotorula toruloides (strain NP11) TaxID=1130832 RepID=M7XWY3_RHOT1|nr:uncharacterized protein RHTO_04918 [Rhodotorula toruloides NP11]EMS24738.1 hypothetical protein RHTO_04918 [Rhodotorula toruloides NP11]